VEVEHVIVLLSASKILLPLPYPDDVINMLHIWLRCTDDHSYRDYHSDLGFPKFLLGFPLLPGSLCTSYKKCQLFTGWLQ